jgi:hypothetical protein
MVDDAYQLAPRCRWYCCPAISRTDWGVRLDRTVRALFCADAIHSPLQALDADSRPPCVIASRRGESVMRLLEDAAEDCRLIVPAHFRGTGRMHIHRTATGFRPCFD